ncbi:MAG: end-binding protein Ku [Methylobacteriaceae bacterium]|nr:end-binding protein Ku [Methylobacteriaceae bacterium]
MAPPRPYWKGYLKLSLVSCPIALYAATSSSERVSFRQINRKTGNRLRQQLIDDVTREPVEAGEKGRGYEVTKNQYILIEDDEIDTVAVESNHTIEIDSFVPRAEMDERYLDSPYYLVPDDRVGQEAFAVIRDAMRGKDMVALGRVVLAKRERVIMLQPWDKGLMGTTLRYAYEVRDTSDLFSGITDMKIAKDMLALAEHILETKAGEFEPQNFHDRYEDAVVEMLRRKQAGMPAVTEKAAPAPTNVVSLMDALKKSLAVEDAKAPAAAAGKAKKPKKAEGQREMLLPIAGKGAGKAEAAKPAAKAAPAKTGARQRKAG